MSRGLLLYDARLHAWQKGLGVNAQIKSNPGAVNSLLVRDHPAQRRICKILPLSFCFAAWA